MRQFEFDKTYEELEIAGKTYRIYLNDEKILEHQEAFEKYQKKANELSKAKTDTPTQSKKAYGDMKKITKDMIEQLLGEGTFDELYEKAGGSIFNLTDLIMEIGQKVIGEFAGKLGEKREKYLKYKKKK